MKILNAGLIYPDFEKRISVKLLPELTGKIFDKQNYLLAELLVWLKSFNKAVHETRNIMGIKQPFIYEESKNLEEFFSHVYKNLTQEQVGLLKSRVKEIAKRYHLTENWEFPLEIAILTHMLPVPNNNSIQIHFPPSFYPKKEGALSLAEDITRMREWAEMIQHPAIFFTAYASIDEMKRWIDKNKNILRGLMVGLPKKKRLKRKERAVFWGQIAWIILQEGKRTWKKLVAVADYLVEKSKQNNSAVAPLDEAPDEIQFRLYYERFLSDLHGLDSPQ